MDPLIGGAIGLGLGGVKSIIESILHKNAVRKAAKANMFAYGGRPGVEYPGEPPSIIGNLISGGAAGASLAQSLSKGAAETGLINAQAEAVGRSPQGIFDKLSIGGLGVDTSMPDTLTLEDLIRRAGRGGRY